MDSASARAPAGATLIGLLGLSLLGCASPAANAQMAQRETIMTPSTRSTLTSSDTPAALWPEKTYYRSVEVEGRPIFYREAGVRGRPIVLLLHGFPASSHSYRELIPLLSGRYHVLAPDYLGSGFSARPSPRELTYTFDLLAQHVTGFIEALGLERYAMYMQDFGAPVGYRVALRHPQRLRALIVQNANAYSDGLSEQRRLMFRRMHDDRSPEGLLLLEQMVSEQGVRDRQYLRDVPGEKRERMSPDTWTHDLAGLGTADDRAIQMQLFQDYQTNIDAYPRWQAFLREHQPPTLIVWGEHDPAFTSPGARAYLRDLPQAELHLLDAGHFALEEQPTLIAQHIVRFMERLER